MDSLLDKFTPLFDPPRPGYRESRFSNALSQPYGGAAMRRSKVVCETPVYKVMLVQDSTVPVTNKCIRAPEDAVSVVTEYLRGVD